MDFIGSPLGRLTINAADDNRDSLKACIAVWEPEVIFFSIKLTTDGFVSSSANLAKSRMDNFEKFSVLASRTAAMR
ncbi:hypothetical protein [Plantibacter sp. 2H11-2]|uniref:hypothetical protein n=1 Tax=Plantibacter sp. 2H11-2 TaxID=3414431 RepID=UPI003CF533B5